MTTDLPLKLEYVREPRKLVATNRLSKDEDGESQIVAYQVAPWFGKWAESAWRQAATPDAPAGLDVERLGTLVAAAQEYCDDNPTRAHALRVALAEYEKAE